jgi:WD40 repeat protein
LPRCVGSGLSAELGDVTGLSTLATYSVRLMTLRVIAALALLTLSGAGAAAGDERTPKLFANAPFTSWETDGAVLAILATPNAVYIGGNFTLVGHSTGSSVALTPGGRRQAGWPETDGDVAAIVSDGRGGWFLGGSFNHVGGIPMAGLAHITSRRKVDPRWRPTLTPKDQSGVRELVRTNSTLYVGGNYLAINGKRRHGIAALDTKTGALRPWNPRPAPYSIVETLALSPDGRTLFFAGIFDAVGGRTRGGLAAVDAATGALRQWNPRPAGIPNFVNALAPSRDGRTIFVGGAFRRIGGKVRAQIAQLDTRLGRATAWNAGTVEPDYPGSDAGDVRSIAFSRDGSTLFVGGFFEAIGGQHRNHLAALDVASGHPMPWDPNVDDAVRTLVPSPDGRTVYIAGDFLSVGRQARHGVAAVDAATGALSPWDPRPNSEAEAVAVSADSQTIYISGGFTSVGGAHRSALAAFSPDGQSLLSWNPRLRGIKGEVSVNSIALGMGGSTLYLGGQFRTVRGHGHRNLAAVSTANGAPLPWKTGAFGGVLYVVRPSPDGQTLYAGGSFSRVGGKIRPRLAAVNASTGAVLDWNPVPRRTVTEIAVRGRTVFVGGGFGMIGHTRRFGIAAVDEITGAVTGWDARADRAVRSMVLAGPTMYVGGGFTEIGGKRRSHLAGLDIASATASPWDPGAGGVIYVIALSPAGDRLYAAGHFIRVGDVERPGIAEIETHSGAVTSWNPDLKPFFYGDAVAVSPDGSTLYVGGGMGLAIFR